MTNSWFNVELRIKYIWDVELEYLSRILLSDIIFVFIVNMHHT